MIAYRHAKHGNPLRTEPARQAARYHTAAESSPTQYLCLHPLGLFAEIVRANSLRQADQARHVRARTWALRLDDEGLMEIGFEKAGEFAVEAADLVDDDPTACQRLAADLRARGARGIVVPSAALPGTQNVVLFGPRVGSPYLLEPLAEVDVPASITTEDGRPIASLLDRVRFRGDEHAALVAWQQGQPFEFQEPDWEELGIR
jgi:hypothetical protein